MRQKASNLPNVRLEQGTVTSLLKEDGTIVGVSYKTGAGKQLKSYAPLTVVCDGCFSNLRRTLCSPKMEVLSHLVGFILKDCQLSCPNYAYSVLGDHSIALFYPISSTEVRCLVDVSGNLPSIANGEMAAYLKTTVASQIQVELRDAFVSAIDRGNLRAMPNKSMSASPSSVPGALLLGDAYNMRHPLTGGGMTVTLSDVIVLRNLLKPVNDFRDPFSTYDYLKSFHALRKPAAFTINTIADVVYKVFNDSPTEVRDEILVAYLGYLDRGGVCSKSSMALLGCLDTRPASMLVFVAGVTVYTIGHFLLQYPSLRRTRNGATMVLVSSRVISNILRQEKVWQLFIPTKIPTY